MQHQAAAAKELIEHLQLIETGLQKLSVNGPYWLGEKISLVDLAYYPMFEQWAVLEHFRGLKFPIELNRLKHWRESMANRESVLAIAHSQEFYLDRYAQYAQFSQQAGHPVRK